MVLGRERETHRKALLPWETRFLAPRYLLIFIQSSLCSRPTVATGLGCFEGHSLSKESCCRGRNSGDVRW